MKTIFGVATAPGRSGVAVIRISGHSALAALAELGGQRPEVRKAELRKLVFAGELIDEAVVIYFKAPHSFTGEDVVELQVHGSRAVVKRILEILSRMPDLRLAEPGEFSRRAFENGRMDLTAAEGLADLIDAETTTQHKQAMRQMQGELGKIYDVWRKEIIETLAFIEAYIDFPDEDLPEELVSRITGKIKTLKSEIKNHLNDNRRGEKIREGIHAVILGAPNVGKSSLLNWLAGREAAIVSAVAGTTRDVIEVQMEIGGYPVTIADTAGLRETADEIENEGIRRAKLHAENADIKILIFEAGMKDAQTEKLIDENSIRVISKTDIVTPGSSRGLAVGALPLTNNRIAEQVRDDGTIGISLKTGEGLDKLLQTISQKIATKFGIGESPLITRARHREALQKALAALENFSLEKPIELAGEDLRYAAAEIGRITGRIEVDDILDVIFSSFCIGK